MSTLKEINIRDGNFGHHPLSIAYKKEAKHFKWCRDNRVVSKSCFITDLHLHEAPKCHAQRKIGWLVEPRAINPGIYNYADKNYKQFDYILTFDQELVESGRNFLFYPYGTSWIEDCWDFNPEKTKLCSMIASDKKFTAGHAFRQEVIKKFSGIVDHYGRGFTYVEDKEEALADYHFSIVIENSQSNFYFSEKLLDCFACKTIPIYWGCDGIKQFFNTDGMFLFNDMEELENIVSNLSQDQYEEKIKYGHENLKTMLADNYHVTEDWLYEKYPFLFD